MELNEKMQIGGLRKKLMVDGVTCLGQIAQQLSDLKSLQIAKEFWCHDRILTSGSRPVASVTKESGEKQECIIWSTNHYLGLNRHPGVIAAAQAALSKYGSGAGTSAISGGQCDLHRSIEAEFMSLFRKEAALVFPTGFTANYGTLRALGACPNTIFILDKECHASIVEGITASSAKFIPFKHNDIVDLAKKLTTYCKKYSNVIVVTEAAFSMSGDIAPLVEICALKSKHDFYLFVDEAHSFGFYGENGAGLCDEFGVLDSVDFVMTTLSKSTASVGGVVVCSKIMAVYIQTSCRAYIFQACLPPADAAATLKALEIIRTEPIHAERLHQNNKRFRSSLSKRGFDLRESQSPVVRTYSKNSEVLYRMNSELFKRGIFSIALTYPSVGAKDVGFRFIVTAAHTEEDIDSTVDALSELHSVLIAEC